MIIVVNSMKFSDLVELHGLSTISYKISETNSSFRVKQRTTGNI